MGRDDCLMEMEKEKIPTRHCCYEAVTGKNYHPFYPSHKCVNDMINWPLMIFSLCIDASLPMWVGFSDFQNPSEALVDSNSAYSDEG